MKGWKKIHHQNGNQKKTGRAIFILDEIYLKIKTVTRDEEGYYIMMIRSIQEETREILDTEILEECQLTTIKGEINCTQQ